MKHRIFFILVLLILLLISVAPLGAQDAIECGDGLRAFDHDLVVNGPVCIPEVAERVVTGSFPSSLYPFTKPVGAFGVERDVGNFPFLADWAEEITEIGLPYNLEVITTLQPDLIMVFVGKISERNVELLEEIAPTVVINEEQYPGRWRDQHRLYGELLNMTEVADNQLEVVDQRIDELQAEIDDVQQTSVALVTYRGDANIRFNTPLTHQVAILQNIGFMLPEALDYPIEDLESIYGEAVLFDGFYVQLSLENLQLLDEDILIILTSAGGEENQEAAREQLLANIAENPIWTSLDVFQRDDVYVVTDAWFESSLLGTHAILDDLADIFAVETKTDNPYTPEETSQRPPA